mmetsp:Transcript_11173/g.30625  ORF Transcript_11173/g.30625 Transcript_11173/m.30625 type:complete len:283 (-) Transcript_11173:598-1446(-)
MVGHIPLLAKALDQCVSLFQVVSRKTREQVVVHLVLETTAEPVDKPLRNAMSSRNVTSGSHLQLPKVWSGFGVVDGHSVVTQSKDRGQEETTGASHNEEQGNRVGSRESSKASAKGNHPHVVQGNSHLFEDGVLKSDTLKLKSGIFSSGSNTKGGLEGFVQPRKTGQQEDGEVGPLLIADHELDKGRVLAIRVEFTVRLSLLHRPSKDRHSINIGIAVLRSGGRVVKVGHSVVSVVLVLPPLYRETLHQVSPEEPSVVPVSAVAVDLVVQEIVRQPSALLKK